MEKINKFYAHGALACRRQELRQAIGAICTPVSLKKKDNKLLDMNVEYSTHLLTDAVSSRLL